MNNNDITIDIYYDGQPSDWIENIHSKTPKWHTFSFLVIDNYEEFSKLEKLLLNDLGGFEKWSAGEPYRTKFINSFCEHWSEQIAFLNIVSFDQIEILNNFSLTLNSWSESGQPISVGLENDSHGNEKWLVQYVSFDGFHCIDLKQKKYFTLLPLAYLIRSQYFYYFKQYGYSNFSINLILDPISGDDEKNTDGLKALKNLVLFQDSDNIRINFSEIPKSIQSSQNYIVDNTSGLFNYLLNKTSSTEINKKLISKVLTKITWKQLRYFNNDYRLENISLIN